MSVEKKRGASLLAKPPFETTRETGELTSLLGYYMTRILRATFHEKRLRQTLSDSQPLRPCCYSPPLGIS